MHPSGTVALSRTSGSAGFAILMGRAMATSQDFATWTPGPKLRSEYLLWCLRTMHHDLMVRLAMGSTHLTIYFPDLLSIKHSPPSALRSGRSCAEHSRPYRRQQGAWISRPEVGPTVRRAEAVVDHGGGDGGVRRLNRRRVAGSVLTLCSDLDSAESGSGGCVHPRPSVCAQALDGAPVGEQHLELLPRCPGVASSERDESSTAWLRIAAVSAGRDAMCESRLMITQFRAVTIGIHSGSFTLGDVTGHAGRTRRLIIVPRSPGKVQSGRSVHTT